MAAHKLTGLKQVAKVLWEGGARTVAEYLDTSGALFFDCWTTELGMGELLWLTDWVLEVIRERDPEVEPFGDEFASLNARLAKWTGIAFNEWKALGKPTCREDWIARKEKQNAM